MYFKSFVFVCICIGSGFTLPYKETGTWFKGNVGKMMRNKQDPPSEVSQEEPVPPPKKSLETHHKHSDRQPGRNNRYHDYEDKDETRINNFGASEELKGYLDKQDHGSKGKLYERPRVRPPHPSDSNRKKTEEVQPFKSPLPSNCSTLQDLISEGVTFWNTLNQALDTKVGLTTARESLSYSMNLLKACLDRVAIASLLGLQMPLPPTRQLSKVNSSKLIKDPRPLLSPRPQKSSPKPVEKAKEKAATSFTSEFGETSSSDKVPNSIPATSPPPPELHHKTHIETPQNEAETPKPLIPKPTTTVKPVDSSKDQVPADYEF